MTDKTTIRFNPITDEQTRQYVSWQYEPPYDIYNENLAQVEKIVAYYRDPQFQGHGMTDADGRTIGICSFGPDGRVPGGQYAEDALDIGLAIRPDLTGQGQGQSFIRAVLTFAWKQYNPPACRVTIAAFNRRAQRVWQKAGFVQVEKFGRQSDGEKFVILIKENLNH
jgi:RimJ/RimL family protein N-acetyltransferase